MKVTFTENALVEYIYWQQEDKKTLKRINQFIQDIQRNGFMFEFRKKQTFFEMVLTIPK